ncbi:MAG: SDR family oxidoreductase [Firmicutes bacterium]|nr:SDR family oxidoreductase [Bacillota bacterium]
MEFKDKVVVITGGAHGIGKCTVEEFEKRGAKVCIIDLNENPYYVGDISDKETLEKFAEKVIGDYGKVDYLINNAPPLFIGIDECSYEDFSKSLAIGVTAAFYLTKLFKPYFAKGASIVNISSSRDRQSYPQSESYTAAKGGIQALTHALAMSLAGIARVNSISPGWIDHTDEPWAGADSMQHPVRRVGRSIDIANTIMFLCSDNAGFITGENICVDGGMTKLMIYHDDHGWKYEPEEYEKEFIVPAITEQK